MSSMEGHPESALTHEEIRQTVRALAKRVAELEARAIQDGDGSPSLGFSDDKLATIASSMYRSRQLRAQYFRRSLLSDPAWDMLLDLFINKVRGRRVATTSVCLAANVPQATGLRLIEQLSREGLLLRASAHDDGRLKLVEITSKGFDLMRRFISDSVTRFDMPMPD